MSAFIQDPTIVIDNIAGLSSDHPEEVAKLLEAYEAALAVQVDQPVLAGADDPEKVEDVILELAKAKALGVAEPGQLSPIQNAKHQVFGHIRRLAVHAVQKNQKFYINQYAEMFNQAAELYASEVVKLPTEFDTIDVTEFSAEQFEAFRNVQSAVGVIKSVRSFLNGLPDLSAQLRKGDEVSIDLLVMKPSSEAQFNLIQFPDQPENSTFAKIAPHYRAALEHGAKFKISTVAEATQTYRKFGA